MKKILLTATVQSHIVQFHRPLVEILHECGYEVHVAARDNLIEKNGLRLDFVDKIYNVPFSRSPKNFDNIKAYKQIREILEAEHYDIVHCNTPMGGIVTRLAAIKTRKGGTRVIYTAHGFHFYKGAPIRNWLIFYPVEKIMAHFCDTLITITKEDYILAKKRFHTRVEHIHGVGVDADRYHPVSYDEQMAMRKTEGLNADDFVILCTGELNENKNQKTLVEVAYKLKDRIPDLKVLLAGNGPLEGELRNQIKLFDLTNTVLMLGYRIDLERITPAVDVVVSCSFREGMPLNIIEAMLCKKPVVVSVNRGHKELVREGHCGYLVNPKDVDMYVEYILGIYKDPALKQKLSEKGFRSVQLYTSNHIRKELKDIYSFFS